MVISHEDDERVDVIAPSLKDILHARIFYHRGHHIILAPITPDLKSVLESRVRRETSNLGLSRKSVCGTRLVRPGGCDRLHDIL